MEDKNKTKEQLLDELRKMHLKISQLESLDEKRKQELEKLQESESRYKALLEYLPQKVFFKNKDSIWIAGNSNFLKDLKITPEELNGKTDFDFFPKELAEKYRTDDRRIMESGKMEEIVENYIKDGQEFIVNTLKTPIKDEKGNVIGIGGMYWDITERKRADEELIQYRDHLEDVIRERSAKLNRRNAVLAAINEVFRQRINCKTIEDLGKTCLKVAEELTGSKFSYLGEINPSGLFDTLAITNPGWDECKVPNSEAMKITKNMKIRGIDRVAMKEGKSRIVNDLTSHPDAVGFPEGHPPVTSFLGVPFKYEGKTVGMIGLSNKESGYTTIDQENVEALSLAIVEALRSKKSEEKVAVQSQEILTLSTPILQIWDGVVVAPLIGMLDSQRTQQFMERLLTRIVETNSPVALVDITGVPIIDTQTAQYLIETITAVRLLGSQVILTGVRPSIAQTLVHLGIDLSDIITRSSLIAGLRVAFDFLNFKVVSKNENH